MNVDLVVTWTRAVLLLALLTFFLGSLLVGLTRGHAEDQFGHLRQGYGLDPGVRVLLENRPATPSVNHDQPVEPSRTFESVEVTVLQPVDVLTPDDPDNPDRKLMLRSGAKLVILPDAIDGIVLLSKDWGDGGKELRWAVTRVRVQPHLSNPPATPAEAKAGPGHRDPTGFEAADSDEVFALQGRRYRGSAEVLWASPKELRVVNCLPFEAYVDGVVAVEMSPSFPLEALKAQAIVSRSYAYAHAWTARSAHQDYDVLDGDEDQEYRGTGNGTGLVTRAVVATRGIVTFTDLSHGECPFSPMFSASSGGYGATLESVLPDARDAYGHPLASDVMPAIRDVFCQPAAESLGCTTTHWQTTDVIKPTDIRAALARLYKRTSDPRLTQIGYIHDFRVGRRNPQSNRVETVIISRTQGDPIEMSAQSFRMLLGPGRIRSTLWTPESPKRIDFPDGRRGYQISCFGWGHGVGMSQISAVEMARQGLQASDILRIFYPRVVMKPIW